MLTFSRKQKDFLKFISTDPFFGKFYLSGGTALSAVYYHHRESEDLDFFSAKEFSGSDLQSRIASSKKMLKWDKISRSHAHGINYYVLFWRNGQKLKLDFNYFVFKSLSRKRKACGVMVDSLLDIAVNKFEMILLRGLERDFVDLYFIITSENISLSKIINLHKKKFKIDVDQMQIIKSLLRLEKSRGYPIMKVDFSFDDMVSFYRKQAELLKQNIIK